MKLSYFLGLIGVTATLGIASCVEKQSIPPEAYPANNANVLTVNAAPESSALDMVIGTAKYAINLVFQGSTGYMRIPAGSDIAFNKAGTSNKVFGGTENLLQDKNYSAFLCSEVTPTTAGAATTTLKRFVIGDDLSQPRDSFAKIRFVHAVADMGAGEVFLQDHNMPTPATNISGTSNLGFKQATNFAEVRVVFSEREDSVRKNLAIGTLVNGEYTIKFAEPGQPVFEMLAPLLLKNQQIYTVYLSNFKNSYMIDGKAIGGNPKFISLVNK